MQIGLSTIKNGEFDVSCYGWGNSTVFPYVTGGTPPYYYQWNYNTNQWAYGDNFLYGAIAGTVTLHVLDANNNYAFKSIVITQPDPILVDLVVDLEPSSCSGNDGKLVANVTGGSEGYSYNWTHDPGNSNPSDQDLKVSGNLPSIQYNNGNGILRTLRFYWK
jgi:hypothetical protein